MTTDTRTLNPDAPAHYRIRAQGIFDACWLEMLSGVWVIKSGTNRGSHITVFMGSVADQAALFGVLNHLYNLGMALISVEWLLDASEKGTQPKADHRHVLESEHQTQKPHPPPDQISG